MSPDSRCADEFARAIRFVILIDRENSLASPIRRARVCPAEAVTGRDSAPQVVHIPEMPLATMG
ncbi:hypothetical protein WK53_23965 [Burkholderia ubonensis]|uniref:Uncharacterized protein n=1 Tax=Burkholderia ubonensis TaxID=101571 RepID=A0AAW3NLB6_9BURK|nr:hypothetical protein WK53_23965 [Burkholderia ubonensis]